MFPVIHEAKEKYVISSSKLHNITVEITKLLDCTIGLSYAWTLIKRNNTGPRNSSHNTGGP